MKSGIEDLAFYVPNIYLSIAEYSKARGIEVMKLKKGLGLEKMALPDYGEDAASMAANALIKLFEQNDLNPNEIGRIYLGTESALDAAKPTATYALEMLQDYLSSKYGKDCCSHIDCVDMTFACIGAVDAMQNTLDWVKAGSNRKGIVVASDFAKYELESSGEYTQGAGAVAALISNEPKVMEFDSEWTVSTKSVHDFFKPRKKVGFNTLTHGAELKSELKNSNVYLEEFRETPVFDGQFSNQCYEQRMTEAYERFESENEYGIEKMDYLVFHLPYAFHGRRIIASLFIDNYKKHNNLAEIEQEVGLKEGEDGFLRAVTKSATYKSFVQEKIAAGEMASSEVGNMYTASIFLSFMSLLSNLNDNDSKKRVGFIAYGSGSKAKVFSGVISDSFGTKAAKWNLFKQLEQRVEISFAEYLNLHTGQTTELLRPTESHFLLSEIKAENLEGERVYKQA